MNNLTNKDAILNFLKNIANNNIDSDPVDTIIEFLHRDINIDIIPVLLEKISCKYNDFNDYFESRTKIDELIALKETDLEKYYSIIHYENILLNMLCNIVEMPYTIVLDPDDLSKSYYLVIKLKN